jgi:hypothetical protein
MVQRAKSKKIRQPSRSTLAHWTAQPTISLPWRQGRNNTIPKPLRTSESGLEQLWQDETCNSTDGSIQFEQRFKELGILAKSSRKKLKDLFDIESLGSLKDRQRKPTVSEARVPVMPPAPNASIRIAAQHPEPTKSYAMLRNASMRRAQHTQSQSEVICMTYLDEIRNAMKQKNTVV